MNKPFGVCLLPVLPSSATNKVTDKPEARGENTSKRFDKKRKRSAANKGIEIMVSLK
jgi:hypothetical protein